MLGAAIGAVAGLLTSPAEQMLEGVDAGVIIGAIVGTAIGLRMYARRKAIAAARQNPDEALRLNRLRAERRQKRDKQKAMDVAGQGLDGHYY